MKKYEIVKEHKHFEFPRFGIAVGKKVGNAVIRNKLKRQYRMLITSNKKLFSKGVDYIIIVKRSSLEAKFQDLEIELKRTLEK